MSALADLQAWIAENRPDLAARIKGLDANAARHVLNAETKAQVPGFVSVEGGSRFFLKRLKEMKLKADSSTE